MGGKFWGRGRETLGYLKTFAGTWQGEEEDVGWAGIGKFGGKNICVVLGGWVEVKVDTGAVVWQGPG